MKDGKSLEGGDLVFCASVNALTSPLSNLGKQRSSYSWLVSLTFSSI